MCYTKENKHKLQAQVYTAMYTSTLIASVSFQSILLVFFFLEI